jgi:hypothetical protein
VASSTAGLEGLREREWLARGDVVGSPREVVDAFVEEEFGETMDSEDEDDAFETLRSRGAVPLGPALGKGCGELFLVSCGDNLSEDGMAPEMNFVSILRWDEYI